MPRPFSRPPLDSTAASRVGVTSCGGRTTEAHDGVEQVIKVAWRPHPRTARTWIRQDKGEVRLERVPDRFRLHARRLKGDDLTLMGTELGCQRQEVACGGRNPRARPQHLRPDIARAHARNSPLCCLARGHTRPPRR